MLQCCKMKERTKGIICIETRVRFAETARCLWMFVVTGAIARIILINSIFFQAGSSLDQLSLWFVLKRMLPHIIGHIQMAQGNRHLVAIKVKPPTTNIVGRRHSEIEFVAARHLMFDSGELVTMGLGSDQSLQKICAKSGC